LDWINVTFRKKKFVFLLELYATPPRKRVETAISAIFPPA